MTDEPAKGRASLRTSTFEFIRGLLRFGGTASHFPNEVRIALTAAKDLYSCVDAQQDFEGELRPPHRDAVNGAIIMEGGSVACAFCGAVDAGDIDLVDDLVACAMCGAIRSQEVKHETRQEKTQMEDNLRPKLRD